MNIRYFLFFVIAAMLAIVTSSCDSAPEQKEPLPVIGLSKSYNTYQEWLQDADSSITFVNLYGLPVDEALDKMSTFSGVLLTGGEDIHPSRYQQAADTAMCNTIDTYRDSLESAIIHKAVQEGIPLLGICRGMQMMNVVLGGTLYADIPSQLSFSVAHRKPEFEDTLHRVEINQVSMLHLIGEVHEAVVLSNHHQGVDELAHDLRAVANADDGLIEAVEWEKPAGKSFFLGVQFHPERNHESELSTSLAAYFTKEVDAYYHEQFQVQSESQP